MRHLSDGALRRLYDEPYALDEVVRAHYSGCEDCQARFTSIADDARHAADLMAVPAVAVDPASALNRVKALAGQKASSPRRPWAGYVSPMRAVRRRPLIGALAAAAVVVALVATMITPLGANLIQIFQPTRIQTVSVGRGDLTGLDAFSSWGDVKWTKTPSMQEAASAAEASHISGLPVIAVDAKSLPSALAGAPVTYAAVGQASGSVTFNANAPSTLHGSTLNALVGPAETAIYGDLGKLARAAGGGGAEGGSGSAQPTTDNIKNALAAAGPIIAVAEMRAPQVSSTGASVTEIKKALLAQPGLSQAVRDAISSIDDPKGTLPLPIPAGYVNAHNVTVQHVQGTALGDNTGLFAAVIWIKNGRVYGVAGTVTETEALAVANSLS